MQRLAERLALVDPLHALLGDEPLAARGRAAHDPALVVEVREHDEDAAALLAERVLDGDLDLVEDDVRRARGGRVRGLDRLRRHALLALDEDDGEAVLGPAADGEASREVSSDTDHE